MSRVAKGPPRVLRVAKGCQGLPKFGKDSQGSVDVAENPKVTQLWPKVLRGPQMSPRISKGPKIRPTSWVVRRMSQIPLELEGGLDALHNSD